VALAPQVFATANVLNVTGDNPLYVPIARERGKAGSFLNAYVMLMAATFNVHVERLVGITRPAKYAVVVGQHT
jgi:hypothetical protein